MSQYLSFYLKRRDTSGLKVDLGYWCTTPARTLSGEGIFKWTESETKVTPELYQSYMNDFDYFIKSMQDSIQAEKDKDYKGLFQGCKTKEAAEYAYERFYDSEQCIAEWKEELELYTAIRDKIKIFWSIAQENSEQYDLYYTNW